MHIFQHNSSLLALLDALITERAIDVFGVASELIMLGTVALGPKDRVDGCGGCRPIVVEVGLRMAHH